MKYLLQRFVRIAIIVAIYAIFILVSLRQHAKAQIIDSSFYQWTVYENQDTEIDYKECYIVAHPIKSDSDHGSRRKPYLMITRFQKDRSEEISVYSGFEYKLNSEIFLMADDVWFKLLAKKDIAWAKTKADDVKIIETLLKSAGVKIRGDSSAGTYAVDQYSLKGITRAYARMRRVCK